MEAASERLGVGAMQWRLAPTLVCLEAASAAGVAFTAAAASLRMRAEVSADTAAAAAGAEAATSERTIYES